MRRFYVLMLYEIKFNENKKICENMREFVVNFDSN